MQIHFQLLFTPPLSEAVPRDYRLSKRRHLKFAVCRVDIASFNLQTACLGVQSHIQNNVSYGSFGVDAADIMSLFLSRLWTTNVSRQGKLWLRGPKRSALLTYLSDADIERMGFRVEEPVVSRPWEPKCGIVRLMNYTLEMTARTRS